MIADKTKPGGEPSITVQNERLKITLYKVLGLLKFTFYRTGGVPKYQFSISKKEVQENPKILDIFKEMIRDWSVDKDDI